MSKNCTELHAAGGAQLLFFLIEPIRSLFSGIVVAIAVVLAKAPYYFHVRAL